MGNMDNALLVAQLILTGLLITASIAAGLRFIRNTGARHIETINSIDKVNGRIDNLDKSITEIKRTLGNGGYGGIRQDVQDIRENCAGKMANIDARVKALEKQPED